MTCNHIIASTLFYPFMFTPSSYPSMLDPNHPNKEGTTALMLSAQMQCMDIMIELLTCGGNLKSVDNEGYTPMAYANSMPCPSHIDQNVVSFIMEGDTHGTAKFTTCEILKIAIKWGIGDLKDELEANREESCDEKIEAHLRFLRLMERNGLTRIEGLSELNRQAAGTLWRIEQEEERQRTYDDHSETSSELRSYFISFKYIFYIQSHIRLFYTSLIYTLTNTLICTSYLKYTPRDREAREKFLALRDAERDAAEQDAKTTMRSS